MLYVDDDGNPLDEAVGRCNREDNCGYHYTPSQFFKDHPDYTRDKDWKPSAVCKRREDKPISFLTKECLGDVAKNRLHSALYIFCLRNIGQQLTDAVFSDYQVTSSRRWKVDGWFASAFPQIDELDRIRQVKVIAYDLRNGKRLHAGEKALKWNSKAGAYWIDRNGDKVWFAGKEILKDQDANLQQTFFGTHLIPRHPESAICVVESEKTALIASLYSMANGGSENVWIATGGKNGCRWTSPEVSYVLKGRDVFLYPDLKCFEDWSAKAETLRKHGIKVQVSHYLEDICTEEERERGLDIADYMLRELINT